MSVVPLTLTISLCLVFTFVVFFIREHSRRRFGSAESEALLPLADETPRVGGQPNQRKSSSPAQN
jgi:cbb3-type cytochrome oxidase subunit 3